MALLKREILLLLIFVGVCGLCNCSVYKVGDSDGWTIMGDVDYNQWASSKTFKIGDTLVFEYDQDFHNVMQVSQSDFESCNPTAPIATYSTGNDSIGIHSSGDYYYICGVEGHCSQFGQKVEIRVPNSPRPTIPGPGPAPHGPEEAQPNPPQNLPTVPVRPTPPSNNAKSYLSKNILSSASVGLLLLLMMASIDGFIWTVCMALLKREIVLVLIFVGIICGFCNCSVYKVGDSVGWTIIANVDYNQWASSKTFKVGDTLVFEYDQAFHNVLQVSRSDFHSCTPAAPMATYATGNDSITIHNPGHYYYICGFAGHCQAGQKVDIRVPRSTRPTIPGPAQAPLGTEAPQDLPIRPVGPAPSPNGAESILRKNGLFSNTIFSKLEQQWLHHYEGKKTRVLSIDGGGTTAIVACAALVRLEDQIQEKTGDPNARVADFFDIVAGTGIGALLAAMLVADDGSGRALHSARGAAAFLMENRGRLFKSRSAGVFRRRTRFSGGSMDAVLKEAFRREDGKVMKISDACKPVLVPCFDLISSAPFVFSRADAVGSSSFDFELWRVIRAAIATPPVLKPYKLSSVDGTTTCLAVDGGLVMNNPTAAAVTHVLHNKRDFPSVTGVEDLLVLSIGNGPMSSPSGLKLRRDGECSTGTVVGIALDGVSESVDQMLGNAFCLNPQDYVRIQANGEGEDVLAERAIESLPFGGKRLLTETNGQRLEGFVQRLIATGKGSLPPSPCKETAVSPLVNGR
ncbi:Probable inactive patatin-like protein 9 [Striga hermonthica]|uniref:Patatin n=1 Tax=Striga hermonthica TaxID=68872 RepID=A0A9N7NG38_STRHE|nr:Probable inactive patatin-like protein 9 [Striga hermonthica]